MTSSPSLPPLRDVIAKHKLSAKKSLGQNFVLDSNLNAKIARLAGPLAGHDVLEVGPGPGGLTRSLIEHGARRVVAIEKDHRFIPALNEIASVMPQLKIIHGDALTHPAESILREPVRIVGNLPFNIATLLLCHWLESKDWPPFWKSLTLMFQRETAERIVAANATSAYGRLSILSQWRTTATILGTVPASAFVPRPKIAAAIVRIEPKAKARSDVSVKELSRITRLAFSHRRKMVKTNLKRSFTNYAEAMAELEINPSARPEQITVEQYCCLARRLDSRPANQPNL